MQKIFNVDVVTEFSSDEILKKISYDYEVYGAFALNIIWSKDRSRITEINYVDVSKLRVSYPKLKKSIKKLRIFGKIGRSYWFSDDWKDLTKYPPVLYQGFSTVNRKKASQIYYTKSKKNLKLLSNQII